MTREVWADFELQCDLALGRMERVRELARPIFDRLYQMQGNAWDSTDYQRDEAWCRNLANFAAVAERLLKDTTADMPEYWR